MPGVVAAAAAALGLSADGWRPLGGQSGRSWSAGGHILRLVEPARVEGELSAARIAAAVVPVAEVLARADIHGAGVLLLRRLPGHPAGQLQGVAPRRARAWGQACGQAQLALTALPAPASLPAAPSLPTPPNLPAAPGVPGPPNLPAAPHPGEAGDRAGADRLLHLDLHPLNVLVDGDRVSGVIDWGNAAAGPASLDRARTRTIFELDPEAVRLAADPAWAALVAGWTEAAGLGELPPAALAWAGRYMLADLAHRYQPAQLAHVRAATQAWQAAGG